MKSVNIIKEVKEMPSKVQFGLKVLRFNITRNYRYTYGVGQMTDQVRVTTTLTTISRAAGTQVFQDTRLSRQPDNFFDPR